MEVTFRKNLQASDYTVIKIFNNNVLFVSEDKKEKILFGKGISFGKHIGDTVPHTITVDKIFTIEDSSNTSAFNELVTRIDNSLIGLCEEVICMISNELNEELHVKVVEDEIAYLAVHIQGFKTSVS